MDFKIGYDVRPKRANLANQIIYEEYGGEGTLIEVTPTQKECEGYGFIYNDGACYVLANSTDFIKIDNTIQAGKRNEYKSNTDDCLFTGIDNTILADCNNDLVVGNNNNIASGIDNTIVVGTKAEATTNNSIVLGGNNATDNLAERQNIIVMAGAETTNATAAISYLNNDGATMIKVPENAIISFNAHALAVRTGGSGAGNKGDFRKWVEEGVVVNIGGTLTIVRTKAVKVSSGTTSGWDIEAKTSGEYLYLELIGKNNRDLKWTIKWNLIEVRTGVDLSA
tara:strand:- start:130 stop:972 length:843 start_codon:yes stop_codon:yes gene_type:complete